MAARNGVVSDLLLRWYARHGRTLPWRTDRSPYRVVVSEFMLQQTQVERVIPAFERFIAAFPSFAALAAAPADAVIRAWRGLGYNTRAVRLQRLARAVCERHGGVLPSDVAALRELPGVGPYTRSAIRAFAYDRDDIALDTNVRRVVHRVVFGVEWPPRAQSVVATAAARLVPRGRGNELNSALMDLGASICTARAPKCLICPLQTACGASPIDAAQLAVLARAHGRVRGPQERLPFEQTTRFLRGRIVDALRALPPHETISLLDLHSSVNSLVGGRTIADVERAIRALTKDGIVAFDGVSVSLARAPARDTPAKLQPNQEGRSE